MISKIILPKNKTKSSNKRDDFVLSSRLRVARNIDALAFPSYLPLDQKRQIENSLRNIIKKLYDDTVVEFDISKYDKKYQQNFESNLLVTDSFSQFGDVFFASKDGSWVLLPNEKDHIRLFSIEYGSDFSSKLQCLNSVIETLEEHIHFAFQPNFGYLTSYANDAGLGLSLSYLINLSGVELMGNIDKLASVCEETGYRLTPYTGVRGTQLFFLRNLSSYGTTQDNLIKHFQYFADKICEEESKCREKLFANSGDVDYIVTQIIDASNESTLPFHRFLEAFALLDMFNGFGCAISDRNKWRAHLFTLMPHAEVFNDCQSQEEIDTLRAVLFQTAYKKYIRFK